MLHRKWKISLPFNIIYFSPGHFVWNYIATIYYAAGKKKVCVGLFLAELITESSPPSPSGLLPLT